MMRNLWRRNMCKKTKLLIRLMLLLIDMLNATKEDVIR